MKKKLIFAIATVFFAVATVFNMNMVQGNDAGDVMIESIAVMARAQYEGAVILDFRHNRFTVCVRGGGRCIVSNQDPCQAGYC
ncbi:hypothetical protein [Natronoflexus pectinivorans]|uniref:Uncharacterized protein n=1 Tax=Natronoflexus pectinivorans TaxID=682526 RepID=A0A4R2G9G2_9BACT|nr:hypothetical protein [Natronoflexus pectinivorans]TCO04413.1 hypothetical protein EV194_1182 [Natronoflexus pectinivorans]